MMSEFWKTKKFSKLNDEWKDILEKSGFDDIEREVNGTRLLINYSAHAIKKHNQVYMESRYEYFRLVRENSSKDYHMTKRDKIIMTMYGDGESQKNIINTIIEMGGACSRITITRTISQYLSKWRIPLLKPRKTK